VADYERRGILPEAMVNFLALLGWNPGDEREVMSRDELVAAFSLERVQKKSAVFDTDKLEWLNGQYLSSAPASRLVAGMIDRLAERGVEPDAWAGRGEAWLHALVDLLKVRARTVDDLARQALPYLIADPPVDAEAADRHWGKDPEAVRDRLAALRARLEGCEWGEQSLETLLRGVAEAEGVGAGKVIHPLRVALTGQSASPGIFEVMVLLGREVALERLDRALERLRSGHETLS
jgi:glutamyl-tRNA synthetase